MAESAREGPASRTIKCPDRDCGEDVDLEEDGTIPKFCGDCGADLSVLQEMSACPKCHTPRKKKKNGTYLKFCVQCRYDYSQGVATSTLNLSMRESSLSELNFMSPNRVLYGYCTIILYQPNRFKFLKVHRGSSCRLGTG